MIAAWMVYATVVGALVVAGAWAADVACRMLQWPRRGIWAVALAAMIAIPGIMATSATARRPVATTRAAAPSAAPSSVIMPIVLGDTTDRRARVAARPSRFASSMSWLTIGPAHPLRALDRPLGALWLLATASGAGLLAAGAHRLERARRRWLPLGIDAADVLVAESYGPAVAGVCRPVIVLPRWILALAPDDLALVLAHESSHARARDPLLLAVAIATLVLLPWLMPLWMLVVRLRLAIESDCDRRVLRAHPDRRRYGRLLVTVAERALATPTFGARAAIAGGPLGLLDPSRALEARIRDLVAPRPDRAMRTRATALVGVAGAAVVLAGASPRPRSATSRVVTDSLPTSIASIVPIAAPRGRTTQNGRRDTTSSERLTVGDHAASDTAPTFVPPHVDEPTNVREAVLLAAPRAFDGGMGHQSFVWLLYNGNGQVVQSIADSGGVLTRQSLMIPPHGAEPSDTLRRVISAESVWHAFPSLHESQLHSYGWIRVPIDGDTVNVIWARPTSLGWKLSDFAPKRRDAARARRSSETR